jgi:hypothetical protein
MRETPVWARRIVGTTSAEAAVPVIFRKARREKSIDV